MKAIKLRRGFKREYLRYVCVTVATTVVVAHFLIQYFVFNRGKSELQYIHWDLAESLATRISSQLSPDLNAAAVEREFQEIKRFCPHCDFYLLSDDGRIRASSLVDEKARNIAGSAVPLGAIRWFIEQGGDIPEELRFNLDPRFPNELTPFSAAKVSLGAEPGYLYVTLAGEPRRAFFQRSVQRGWIAAAVVALVIIVFGGVGFSATEYLRLRRSIEELNRVIARIAKGELSARIETSEAEELVFIGDKINELAQKLFDTITELKRNDQTRRELISNISHDLNTPLFSAIGYVDCLADEQQQLTGEQRERFLQIARMNLMTLQRLTDRLFELSKLESGDHEPQWESFSLLDVVTEEVLPTFSNLAAQYQLVLDAEYPQDLPRAYGDGELITRVLSNLVENAILYNTPGGTVLVKLEQRDRILRVSVSDTGKGIRAEDLPKVFERSYRASTARKKGEGSGLGLTIVKRILELHHSTIEVESEEGKGTTFSFELQIAGQGRS